MTMPPSGPGEPPHGWGQPNQGQPNQGQPFPGQPYAGQPHFGQPHPGQPYPGPPPRKSKAGLIVGIVVAVLVLGGVGAFLLFGEDASPPTPPPPVPSDTATAQPSAAPRTTEPPLSEEEVAEARGVAEQFVAAVNARDKAKAKALSCGNNEGAFEIYFEVVAAKTPVELVEEPRQVDESRAVFEIETGPGVSIAIEVVGPDTWCVYDN